jgi:SAM-dependent methyltransferase
MDNRVENLDRLEKALDIAKSHPHYLELKLIQDRLLYSLNEYACGDVLDVGCGNKPYKDIFDSNSRITRYIGCDIVQSSSRSVDVICEATKLDFENDSFDTLFSSQTIEHVGDFQLMLNEANRVLKKDGYFILAGPMYWPLHEEPYDFYRFTKHGFEFSLKKAGFQITEILSCGGKWAMLGQVIIHTLPKWMLKLRITRLAINTIFYYLDKKYFDDSNTMNYVVVCKK